MNATARKPQRASSEVEVYRAVRAASGARLTRKQAEEEMAIRASRSREENAARNREQAAKIDREIAERHRAEVAKGMGKLASLRDFLARMENGKFESTDELVMFARALLVEAGTDMEKALFRMGVIKGHKYGRGPVEGDFAEFLK